MLVYTSATRSFRVKIQMIGLKRTLGKIHIGQNFKQAFKIKKHSDWLNFFGLFAACGQGTHACQTSRPSNNLGASCVSKRVSKECESRISSNLTPGGRWAASYIIGHSMETSMDLHGDLHEAPHLHGAPWRSPWRSVEVSMEVRGGLHGGSWSSVEVSMEVRGGSMEVRGGSMEVRGGLHGSLWSSVEVSMEVRGGSIELHGGQWRSPWRLMELRGGLHGGPWRSPWRLMELRGGLHGGPWEEVLSLQPTIPPKCFDIFPPDCGILTRSICVQIFLLNSRRINDTRRT